MTNATKKGQKTWRGATKTEVLARAKEREREANKHGQVPNSPGDAEIYRREMEMVAWIRQQASRMADD